MSFILSNTPKDYPHSPTQSKHRCLLYLNFQVIYSSFPHLGVGDFASIGTEETCINIVRDNVII
jgi:hypothetical protein